MTTAVPTVSVVVPAFQNERFIGATIDSILSQTYADFELIVSDHSSTDGTWEVLQSYDDPRLQVSRCPPGGGAPRNWNAVTAMARGRYIKLVCGDDLLAPNALAKQVQALEAHPSAVLAASRRCLIDAAGAPLLDSRGLGSLSGLVPGLTAIRALVRAGTNLLGEPASVLIRRDALEAAGGWDGDHPYLIDQATYMHVLGSGDLITVPGTLASFRLSNTQWSVRLAGSQARQAAAVHGEIGRLHPDTVSRFDVRQGNSRARVMSLLRRAAYVRWRRRMAASGTAAVSSS